MNYRGAFASVYDAMIGPEEHAARKAYVLSLLRRYGAESGLLLDLACGTGAVTAGLAGAGYEVVAADASPDMLAIARERLRPFGSRVLCVCQDMRTLDLFGTVRAAVCTLDGLNHLLTPEDVLAAFRRVSLFLEPGGVFVFDVNTPYKHRRVLADNAFVFETEECFLSWQNFPAEEDPDLIEMQLDIFRRGENGAWLRDTEEFAERAYPISVLLQLLCRAGFSSITCFGDMTFEPPEKTAQRVCFAAVK